jgi:hypothetical protein
MPHRETDNILDSDWETISNNIGWIIFEDFYHSFTNYQTLEDENEIEMIKYFFKKRNLI